MKKYSSAAVAIALNISETDIEKKFEGAIKKGVDLAMILQLADDTKITRYDDEAVKVSRLLDGVKKLET